MNQMTIVHERKPNAHPWIMSQVHDQQRLLQGDTSNWPRGRNLVTTFVEANGLKTDVNLMPKPRQNKQTWWEGPDMSRFWKHYQDLIEQAKKPNFTPIGKTTLPFGTTVFDFDPDLDAIKDGLFLITKCTGPVGFEIRKRISKRGYIVSLMHQRLEDIALNPGGLRYLDLLVAECRQTFAVNEWDKPGKSCSKAEYQLYWLFRNATKKDRVNVYKYNYTQLYGPLGLRIKLYHDWLVRQGRYATGSRRIEKSYTIIEHNAIFGVGPDPEDPEGSRHLSPAGTLLRPGSKEIVATNSQITKPTLATTQDDWSDIDNRRPMPTQSNLDDGTWHSHGRPTWLKSPGNNPNNISWIKAAIKAGVYETQEWAIEEAIKGNLDYRKFWRIMHMAFRGTTNAPQKHFNEGLEYNKRVKGREEDRDMEWAISNWDDCPDAPPAWGKETTDEAWLRAQNLAMLYDRIGQRSAELIQRTYGEPKPEWEPMEDEVAARPRTKIKGARSIIGTTADSFITAPEGSVEWHRAQLAEADRQMKLQLGKWTDGRFTGQFHKMATQPTVKEIHVATTTDRKTAILAWARGPSAKDFVIQLRHEAIARIEKLEANDYDDSMEREAFQQAPELEDKLAQFETANHELGGYEFQRFLTTKVNMHKKAVRLYNRKVRRLITKAERNEISPSRLNTLVKFGIKALALA